MGDSGGECDADDVDDTVDVLVGEAKRVSVSTRSATRCGCTGVVECGGECEGERAEGDVEPERAGGGVAVMGRRAGDVESEVAVEVAGVTSSAGMLMTNLGRLLASSSSSSAACRPLPPLSLLFRLSPFRPLCVSAAVIVSSSSLIVVEGETGERMSCSCCLMNSSVDGSDIQWRNRSCRGDGCSVSTSMAADCGGWSGSG